MATRQLKSDRRVFLEFLLLSGAGWLCDFCSFTLMVKLLGVPAFIANFISSFVGVTFVWLTSLQAVFGRTGAAGGRFLFFYWSFQFVSILCYSQLLQALASSLNSMPLPARLAVQVEIVAKLVVTPMNLITNFLFMKFLTRLMPATAL